MFKMLTIIDTPKPKSRDMKNIIIRYRPKTIWAILLFLLLLWGNSQAQILEPVKWHFSSEHQEVNQVLLRFTATIEPGWHLYSQEVPENGPIPTTFTFNKSDAYKPEGRVSEPRPYEEFDESFGMDIKFFKDEVVFTQIVHLKTDDPVIISGSVEFMVCDDSRCLPPTTVDFSFPLNGATEMQTENVQTDSQSGAFFDTDAIDTSELSQKEILDPVKKQEKRSLWGFFFFAMLAGLAAIFTPCVFPMIPMTVTFFMHDKDKKKGKLQALVYGFSIILIYTVVGTLVAVTFGASFANWLSTHWIPNVLFFLIFMFFAASFLGMFEITLPGWMITKTDKQADRGGLTGAFFMAFTLVLVSFSCTGPLVGAILVESAGGAFLKPIVGMLGFSIAFALPFTLFAFFPSWLSNLPKSGGWLNSVKVVLGLIELALGLKFLSIADQTYHWGILDREIYLAIWIVIFAILGFYLLGKIKFANDSDVKHVSVPRLAMAIITFSFVVYLIPGMFGAPLKALSGYLPPQTTHDFDINKIVRDNLRVAEYGGDAADKKRLCDSPKFHEFLHLPHGLDGYFDYEQGMACAKKLNKPVFIDFTGHGCVNCREMEANVWADPRVLKRLRNDYVIIALYVDDKTKLPEQEWVRSEYDHKMKKTIGKKYADFQISRFGVNAQPYYVLLDHDGKMLTSPRAYDLNVDAFIEFLDDGLKSFEKQ
jgi:thiol:disulfide interchange protein DsbD